MQRLPLATAFLTGSSAATVRWTPSSARAALVEPSFFLRFLSVVVRAGTPALLLLALTPAWGEIRGAARLSRPRQATLTWGTRLELWPDTGGKPRVLLRGTDFGPGGCVADVDGDGRDDLLVQEHPGASRMLWLKAPRWTATVVEPETDFHDCLEFTLDGRRGVLVPHFHAQLRLYLFPKFDYKELYSIYTASEQGGLLAHDVDGDGLEDLFIGNYWMRNPGRLDVAWRLFAVNVFHDTPTAARAALGLWQDRMLVWAETTAERARIVAYTPPQDRKQLWLERRLEPLDRPRTVLVQPEGVFIGHAGGVVLEEPAGEGWRRREISLRGPVLRLLPGRSGVVAVSPSGVWLAYPRR